MSDKLTKAQEEQARIVAEQEDAQSVPPYPSQAQIDNARLGLGDVKAASGETSVEASADAVKPGSGPDVEKVVEAGKSPAGYKTRTSKPN